MQRDIFLILIITITMFGCAHKQGEILIMPQSKDQLEIKVMVINYDPIIKAEGKKLHEVCNWNDPKILTEEYINDLKECSGGNVQFKVTRWVEVDAFPIKADGFLYTEEIYMKCVREWKGWHEPDAVDYKAIISDFNLAERVENHEIDEVWVFAPPFTGFWESTMAGGSAYFCNSPPVENVKCSRIFIIMGFNYERGVGEMLEDFCHRAESIMTHVYGSWEPKETHAWNRFTLYDKIAPGKSACGNTHFAPNSISDYDWGNKTMVMSSCDDWLNYPDLTGKKRLVNCEEWGNGDIREHHKWWLHHLPKVSGKTDGKLNNWWNYIVDFNSYPESR